MAIGFGGDRMQGRVFDTRGVSELLDDVSLDGPSVEALPIGPPPGSAVEQIRLAPARTRTLDQRHACQPIRLVGTRKELDADTEISVCGGDAEIHQCRAAADNQLPIVRIVDGE
jgi:hypothetical protein